VGQDLNGLAAMAERPLADYQQGEDCTNGHCDRRGQITWTPLDRSLIDDLEWMTRQCSSPSDKFTALNWTSANARKAFRNAVLAWDLPCAGETGGERMKVRTRGKLYEDGTTTVSVITPTTPTII